jgi:hypothetical protein
VESKSIPSRRERSSLKSPVTPGGDPQLVADAVYHRADLSRRVDQSAKPSSGV